MVHSFVDAGGTAMVGKKRLAKKGKMKQKAPKAPKPGDGEASVTKKRKRAKAEVSKEANAEKADAEEEATAAQAPAPRKTKANRLKEAMEADEEPPKHEPKGVVYLGHIPQGFEESQIKKYFSQFGDVTRFRLVRSRKTGGSKGYGFIEFRQESVAKIVAQTMDKPRGQLRCGENVHPGQSDAGLPLQAQG
eukprot:Skav211971  [mRNA]  locus=scaffold4541:48951:53097:- [translate_table: standard]